MFSVIIPVYNGAEFIENAINSVFNQTYSCWEIILVNDGSSDNTADVLERYSSDERITVINQDNQGVSAARNNGISHSSGEYLVFLDADDVWHTNHLEVMDLLIHKYPDAGLYGTFTRTELVNGNVIDTCHFFENRDTEVVLDDFFEVYRKDHSAKMFTVITTCFSRKAIEVAGLFPVGCAIGEDLELSLRVAAYFPVVLSPVATATYKKTNSTATRTKSFDPDWGFFDSVEKLYADERISHIKRENLRAVMKWFIMRRARHYAIEGKRDLAMKAYRQIGNVPGLLKDKLITLLLILMPSFLVRKIFELRWRGKA